MIRATGATWLNYATTVVFQILFAARFGTATQAGAYVVGFATAASLGGVFVTTALTIALPRMVDAHGALRRPALRLLAGAGALVCITAAALALAAGVLSEPLAPYLGVAREQMRNLLLFGAAFLAMESLAGLVGTIALARGSRFIPTVVPAFPSAVGCVYLALFSAAGTTGTFAAVTIGAVLQLMTISVVVVRSRPYAAAAAPLRVGALATLTVVQLLLFGLLPILQRLMAAVGDSAGPVRFDYAFRGIGAAQQLLIGGLLVAILPDWTVLHQRTRRISEGVVRAWLVGILLLSAAAGIALAAAPSIVRLVFQRGAFTAADTDAVALLVRLMLLGFVAEGMTLILVQGMLATSRNDVSLRLGFVRFGLQAVLTALLGVTFGPVGVAAAYSASLALAFFYAIVLSGRLGLLESGHGVLFRSVGACAMIGAAGGIVSSLGSAIPSILGALAVVLVGVASLPLFGLVYPLLAAFSQAHMRGPGPVLDREAG